MSKYIDADKLFVMLDKMAQVECEINMRMITIQEIQGLIVSLQQEQPECIEKIARISSGLISNFGTSTYVLDVDLNQDEMTKVAPFGFNSGKIKIKIVCE